VTAKPVNTVSSEPKRRGFSGVVVVSSCSRIVLVRVLGCLNVVSELYCTNINAVLEKSGIK